MFNFKKKKIVIDCFTAEQGVADLFPISPLMKNMPSWWSSFNNTTPAPNFPVEFSTVRRCPGVRDLFSSAFCIPAWSEYLLYKDPNQGFSCVGPNKLAEGNQHYEEQLGPHFKGYFHFKFLSPWYIKQKTDLKWLMMHPTWHDNSNITIPPGVLEFKNQHSTHINIVSRKEETMQEYHFKAGDPLAYLIPLTDSKIDLRIHVIDQTELQKMKTFHHSFHNSYELTKNIKRKQT